VEVLLNGSNDLLVVDITCGNDDDIITVVVGSVEVTNVINLNCVGEVTISLNWLSKHVLSERVKVSVFQQGGVILIVVVFMFLADLILHEFKLCSVESSIANHITENTNSFSSVSIVNLKTEASEFSIRVSAISSTHV